MTNQYTVFEYLYRDAGNYKVWGALLLSGEISDLDDTTFRKSLDSGVFFDAKRVGVPALDRELWKWSDGPTDDDHGFHEFMEFRVATDSEVVELPVWDEARAFIGRFVA